MKWKNLWFESGFHVVLGSRDSQAAEMVLPLGAAEGGTENRHRGDEHEIRNTGQDMLRTLNFYVPPAYTSSGEKLPRGRG